MCRRAFVIWIGLIVVVAAPLLPAAANAGDANWNGFYLGANVGYGTTRATAEYGLPGVPLFRGSDDLKGGLYGIQGGYNWQINRFVLGIEADFDGTSMKTSSTRVCAVPACGPLAVTVSSNDKVTWLATVRGRAGFTFDRFLVYATGGAGAGGFKAEHSIGNTLATVLNVEDETRLSWVFGAGVEAAIAPRWSVKLEYLYLTSPDMHSTYTLAGTGIINETDRFTAQMVRAGLNYRF